MPKIGDEKGPKPGRRPGAQNKTTAILKEAILKASELAGEDGRGKGATVGYLKRLANDHPPAFAQLLGKVLPLQLTGKDDGPIKIEAEHRSKLMEVLTRHASPD